MTARNAASTTGEIVDDASTLPTVVPAPTEPVPAEALPVQHDPTDAIHATDPAATAHSGAESGTAGGRCSVGHGTCGCSTRRTGPAASTARTRVGD